MAELVIEPLAPHLLEPGLWEVAQAALAPELARAVTALAHLDARLAYGPEGWRELLVLRSVAALARLLPGEITAAHLALYFEDDAESRPWTEAGRSLTTLAWAAVRWRRMPGALSVGLPPDFPEASVRLHPVLRAARILSARQRSAARGLVRATAVGAADLRGGLRFLPVVLGTTSPVPTGSILDRCRSWLVATELGAQRGLREIDRVAGWQARVLEVNRPVRALSLTVEAMAEAPAITVRRLVERTGLSRASVQNVLLDLEAQGLVAEMTGHSRFRVFTISAPLAVTGS